MGQLNYLSTLQFVDGVFWNSSSGLLEVPTFKIGTINIGDRQNGRLKAKSVIDCGISTISIKKAIERLYTKDFQKKLISVKNLFGDGYATEKIMKVFREIIIPKEIKKVFYDL